MIKTRLNKKQSEQVSIKVLNFKVSGEEFSADISTSVFEVLKYHNVKNIENAVGIVDKTVEYKGEVIPIANLKRCLGFYTPEKEDGKIIVSKIDGQKIGFTVDEIIGITEVTKEDIEPAPEIITSSTLSDYIVGVYKQDGNLVTLIDLRNMLTYSELEQLSELLHEKVKNVDELLTNA